MWRFMSQGVSVYKLARGLGGPPCPAHFSRVNRLTPKRRLTQRWLTNRRLTVSDLKHCFILLLGLRAGCCICVSGDLVPGLVYLKVSSLASRQVCR